VYVFEDSIMNLSPQTLSEKVGRRKRETER
jgi:hypothetical protein